MQKKIHLRRLALHKFKKLCDVLIPAHIARGHGGVGSEGPDQLLHVLLQSFSLIIKDQLGSCIRPGLRNSPGNTPFIGDAEDQSDFSFQSFVTHAP